MFPILHSPFRAATFIAPRASWETGCRLTLMRWRVLVAAVLTHPPTASRHSSESANCWHGLNTPLLRHRDEQDKLRRFGWSASQLSISDDTPGLGYASERWVLAGLSEPFCSRQHGGSAVRPFPRYRECPADDNVGCQAWCRMQLKLVWTTLIVDMSNHITRVYTVSYCSRCKCCMLFFFFQHL